MKNVFHKYFSLFLLTLFLFPQIGKGVHSYEHKNDFFCKTSDKHLHQQQHNCSICEFTIPVTTVPIDKHTGFIICHLPTLVLIYHESPITTSTGYFVLLRSPPLVS